MPRIVALFIVLLSLSANGSEAPTVVIFGDSLSAGYGIEVDQSWTALLQTRLRAQGYEHRVVNASISGETTAGGAARIESALKTFGPSLIILELGGNDGLRGFPPARIKSNLDKIIRNSRTSGAAVILLGIRIPANYGQRYSDAFEGVFRELAASHDVPWIEFFMQGVAMNEELMQGDGIHPNAAAQPRLLDNAWPIIDNALGK